MRVLVVSKLPPQPNGVADYTLEFVRAVSARCDVGVLALGNAEVTSIQSTDPHRFIYRNGRIPGIDLSRLITDIVMKHRYDIIHFQVATFMYPRSMLCFPIFLPSDIKLITTVHDAPSIRQFHYFPFNHLVYQRSERLIVHSRRVADTLQTQHRLSASKLVRMNHGADIDSFNPRVTGTEFRKKYGLGDAFVVLSLGFIRSGKMLEVVLRAYQRAGDSLSKSCLVIAGKPPSGRDVAYLRGLMRLGSLCRSPLKRVLFTGYVPADELPSCMAAADVFVIPYPDATQSGPLHKALASGKAIIATRIPSFTSLLEDSENALLVKPGDADDLREALVRLRRDDAERLRLGAAARKTAVDLLDWNKIARQTISIYNSVA